MIDYKTIAASMAEGLNNMQRAMRAIPSPKSTPELERWTREMGEASKHMMMAFGLDPEAVRHPSIPCGGGWFVERQEGDSGEWHAVQKS
ncbi:MAG TPA: hypothetical protein VMH02_06195 [Verrucomicrobiae bacterium]|nr:hypothetical protein [Verrucomicrobiae bacterium]